MLLQWWRLIYNNNLIDNFPYIVAFVINNSDHSSVNRFFQPIKYWHIIIMWLNITQWKDLEWSRRLWKTQSQPKVNPRSTQGQLKVNLRSTYYIHITNNYTVRQKSSLVIYTIHLTNNYTVRQESSTFIYNTHDYVTPPHLEKKVDNLTTFYQWYYILK